jgi:hypothetical protein
MDILKTRHTSQLLTLAAKIANAESPNDEQQRPHTICYNTDRYFREIRLGHIGSARKWSIMPSVRDHNGMKYEKNQTLNSSHHNISCNNMQV